MEKDFINLSIQGLQYLFKYVLKPENKEKYLDELKSLLITISCIDDITEKERSDFYKSIDELYDIINKIK